MKWAVYLITCLPSGIHDLLDDFHRNHQFPGLQPRPSKGVERITKFMMASLFVILDHPLHPERNPAWSGGRSRFYLIPDFTKIKEYGWFDVIFAAMGQAFFTLSLGIGAMAIFGSYITKDHTLTGESIRICVLDTLVALLAGLIIFPACFAFQVNPGEGPGLVLYTLPISLTRWPEAGFRNPVLCIYELCRFVHKIITVFENIISFSIDLFSWKRGKAVAVNLVLIASFPALCIRVQYLTHSPLLGYRIHHPGFGRLYCFQ